MARLLILGGTGNLSTAMVRQLVERGQDEILVFNRGQRAAATAGVTTVLGDRYDYPSFERQMAALGTFDAVVEMIGYTPADAESLVRAFAGRCGQLVFCSTVDVYRKPALRYPITETNCPYDRTTPWDYASNKVRCEEVLIAASERGAFPLTILRPVQTYGGLWVIDSLGSPTPRHLGRIQAGKPIIVHGDGLSLWGAVHRDDCARAFVNALGNTKAYGNAYHTSPDETLTWRDYQRLAAEAIGAPPPTLVCVPTDLLKSLTPRAFVTSVNFAFSNCFDNAAAKRDLGFVYQTTWKEGVAAAYADFLAAGGALDVSDDVEYEAILAAWARLARTMREETERWPLT